MSSLFVRTPLTGESRLTVPKSFGKLGAILNEATRVLQLPLLLTYSPVYQKVLLSVGSKVSCE